MRKACLVVPTLLVACGGPVEIRRLELQRSFDGSISVAGQPALLKFDTGAMSTLFDRTLAAELSLRVEHDEGTTLISTDSSGAVATTNEFAHDVELRLGELTCIATRVPVFALDPRFTRAGQTNQPRRVGLLGMDVMKLYAMWFDAPGKQLCVVPADQIESFVAARGREVVQRLPITGDTNRPMVVVQIENEFAVQLLLDTGAEATSLPPGTAEKLALPAGEELDRLRRERDTAAMTKQLEGQGLVNVKVEIGKRDGSTFGIHGQATAARPLYHLRSLKLGNQEVRDLLVAEDEQTPALGRDVLATIEWILHGPRRELWLLRRR